MSRGGYPSLTFLCREASSAQLHRLLRLRASTLSKWETRRRIQRGQRLGTGSSFSCSVSQPVVHPYGQ